jgi:hypothetical protein
MFKINKDLPIIRHLVFLIAEIKACLLDRNNYFCRKGNKYLSRFTMRYIGSYLDSIGYYYNKIFKRQMFKSLEELENLKPNLKSHGFEFLPNIDLNELDFVQINDPAKSSKTVNRNLITSLEQAEKFAKRHKFDQIAHKIIGSKKVNFYAVSWNTKVFTDRDAVKTTQWHRDRDGYKVVKFFIHLSDIDENSGPHEYALQSNIVKPFRFVPQIRFSDENVLNFFKTKKILGKKGTTFVAHANGLHKGTAPKKNIRSMLSLNYHDGPIYWEKDTLEVQLG